MPKILIIDDDRLVRESTKAIFLVKGYEVAVAEDGKSGIELARSGQFDLAIVDLFMPGMDGLKVIETIHKSNPDIPMIAASGFMFSSDHPTPTMPNFESMAREAGAIATLYKPFRPDALMQAVEKAMQKAA